MGDLLLKYYKVLKDALLHDIETIRNPKKILLVLKAAGAFQNLQEVNRSSEPGGAQHRYSHLTSRLHIQKQLATSINSEKSPRA